MQDKNCVVLEKVTLSFDKKKLERGYKRNKTKRNKTYRKRRPTNLQIKHQTFCAERYCRKKKKRNTRGGGRTKNTRKGLLCYFHIAKRLTQSRTV